MEKITAKIISYIFHPLLFPTYGVILLFLFPGYLQAFPYTFKRAVTVIFFIMTFIAPVLVLLIFYNVNLIKTFYLETKKERYLPFAVTTIFYISTFIIFKMFPQTMPDLITNLVFASAVSATITFALNFIYKISAHTMGAGTLVGFMSVFFLLTGAGNSFYLSLFVLIAGLIAFARLKQKSHSPVEVYTGFLAGVLAGISAFFI